MFNSPDPAGYKENTTMKKIIHLSDLHIGHRDCEERFEVIIENITRRMQPANDYIIVITGDLADNVNKPYQREKAAMAVEKLKACGFQVLVVPGNHDYGTGTIGNIKNVKSFKERFYGSSEILYPKLDIIEGIAFIGLDSNAEELHWHDRIFAQGELGKEQLDRLVSLLEDKSISVLKKVVYLHHHPFDYKIGRQLKDSDELRKILEKRIDAILFGHYHRSKAGAKKVYHGTWGIQRCYNAGTATHKNDNPGFHRVIDLANPDPQNDYDGCFF